MSKNLTDQEKKNIIDEYKGGRTLRDIGVSIGVSWMTVKRVLEDHRIPRRSPGRRRSFPKERKCTICKRSKPLESFVKEARQYSGYGYICKACHQIRMKKYSITKFGIAQKKFEQMLTAQGEGCVICGRKFGHKKGRSGLPTRLVIDHEHKTGKIRGLLCSRCNSGIGIFEEKIELLEAAIKYLES